MNPIVTFLGLGVMGYPMAGHLSRKFTTQVYNRTFPKAEQWAKHYQGIAFQSAIDAVQHADIVCLCIGRDEDVIELLEQQGVMRAMKPGAIIIDHTTTSAELAERMSTLAASYQLSFLDAPVSGGQAGAENGALTTMVGGDEHAYLSALSVMEVYSKSVKHMGKSGAGQRTKMVNQICIAGLIQGLSEGMQFAQQAGLDGAAVLEVISKGAAQSWQMENRGQTMLNSEYDFGFAVDWMRKDLGYALVEASRNGSLLPVTALVDQFYAEVQSMGGGRWDTSSLMARLSR
ncbi:NAD(P)-dependent oxidoreductase [Echinimonas agarilytica]|uniref:NAD(P)-dependent oxidoreductase n=1 Tax=Echinimonas agarilytica TaxID=1215918 RepID=A0AA41W5U7_9GAMM|nr:NAD(P)-dependent oxidoreductase [Echinimonas agarilytica]MCM2679235.1 NAD(P)-dependent oxidoreductase [Echinimonas agarilytica]